jgi:hypothetical protein
MTKTRTEKYSTSFLCSHPTGCELAKEFMMPNVKSINIAILYFSVFSSPPRGRRRKIYVFIIEQKAKIK